MKQEVALEGDLALKTMLPIKIYKFIVVSCPKKEGKEAQFVINIVKLL